uniref:LITAF domain-containing protein n=1 Tax=Plectus sambesii TaxID=2011161 RepID=A0A914XN54_9BILA
MKCNGQKQVRFKYQQEREDDAEVSTDCSSLPKSDTTVEELSISEPSTVVATRTPDASEEEFCSLPFGERPQAVFCPHCKRMVRTMVKHLPGKMTFVMMAVICCAFFPLLWLPLCLDVCKDAHHFCPDCYHRIGVKRRY